MNERLLAYKILLQFQLSHDRIDKIENNFLKNTSLSQNQNRLLKNLVSGVLRHQSLLDWYISNLYKGNFNKLIDRVKCILRMGFYELLFLENIPDHATVNECVKLAKSQVNIKSSKLVNAILRSFLRQKEDLSKLKKSKLKDNLAISHSFPKWLIERWTKYWGESFTQDLCTSFNTLPVFNIRLNPQKITTEKFENLLHEKGIEFFKSEKYDGCYHINRIREIKQAGFFDDGLCSVQDESAMIPVKLFDFKKRDTFLDVCAAPGGKFTQVLEENPNISMAVAVDENADRLKRLKENLKRLGLKGFIVAANANDLPFKIKFSKILIDVPCSGQGVIGKHPDIKWRRSEKDVKEFSGIQKAILESTSASLNDNGYIVYSTCSIDKIENEDVVNHFLKNNSTEFSRIENIPSKENIHLQDYIKNGFVHTFLNTNKMDGSFACMLKKT